MRVYIPGPLRSYTKERSEVTVEPGEGATLRDLLAEMEAKFPGIRFRMIDEAGRIREHIRFFVQAEAVTSLDAPIVKEVQIICAISGGVQLNG